MNSSVPITVLLRLAERVTAPAKGVAAVAIGALALLGYVAIYISGSMATNSIAGR